MIKRWVWRIAQEANESCFKFHGELIAPAALNAATAKATADGAMGLINRMSELLEQLEKRVAELEK